MRDYKYFMKDPTKTQEEGGLKYTRKVVTGETNRGMEHREEDDDRKFENMRLKTQTRNKHNDPYKNIHAINNAWVLHSCQVLYERNYMNKGRLWNLSFNFIIWDCFKIWCKMSVNHNIIKSVLHYYTDFCFFASVHYLFLRVDCICNIDDFKHNRVKICCQFCSVFRKKIWSTNLIFSQWDMCWVS